jgi:ubiquinone/menaquinone biosynthesis C-methylase UbiE
MSETTTERIVDYYNQRVSQYGTAGQSTLLDNNLRVLEIETVQNWLSPTDVVLEVFCGNGVSSLELAKHCTSLVGCDLSEKMIESARRNLAASQSVNTNVSFEQRNVLDIDAAYTEGQFNTVVSVRGLINLPTRDLQESAILKIHKLLPKGGKFIFIEGFRNGLVKLNEMRKEHSLKPIAEPWYDKYFEEPALSEFLRPYFSLKEERNLDIYFLVSRVLYPVACRPLEPEFANICNTIARLLVPYARTEVGTTLVVCRCLVKI